MMGGELGREFCKMVDCVVEVFYGNEKEWLCDWMNESFINYVIQMVLLVQKGGVIVVYGIVYDDVYLEFIEE